MIKVCLSVVSRFSFLSYFLNYSNIADINFDWRNNFSVVKNVHRRINGSYLQDRLEWESIHSVRSREREDRCLSRCPGLQLVREGVKVTAEAHRCSLDTRSCVTITSVTHEHVLRSNVTRSPLTRAIRFPASQIFQDYRTIHDFVPSNSTLAKNCKHFPVTRVVRVCSFQI